MSQISDKIKTKLKNLIKPLGIIFAVMCVLFVLLDKFIMPLYVQKGKTTKVPNVIGLPLGDARQKLTDAGLEPKEAEYKPDKRYKIGTVTLQNPNSNSEVKFGRGVYLTISGGEEQVDVPNLKGKSLREASFNLERYGLRIGLISYEPSDQIFANTIIRQLVSPNSKVPSGSRIDIVVSQGRSTDMRPVPDILAHTLSEAEKILIEKGFRIGKVSYQVNLDLLPSTILEQSPRAGELMQLGTMIDLVVAQKTEVKPGGEN